MIAAIVAVAWGVFKQPNLAAAAILMWGLGDGAAALVGIPFDRHKVRSRLTDGKKSWEGSAAMLLVSFLTGLGVLIFVQHLTPVQALPAAGIAALAGTMTELILPSEYDTITVPAAVVVLLLILAS